MTPSWDLFILLFFIALVAYGVLLQRDKAVVTMISIYVAIVVSAILVNPISQFFAGEKTIANSLFIRSNANTFTIQTVVFLAIAGLVSTKSGIEGRNSNGSMFEVIGLSILNAALVVVTIVGFMDPAKQEAVLSASRLARFLTNYQVWLLVLPVLFLIVTGWNRKD